MKHMTRNIALTITTFMALVMFGVGCGGRVEPAREQSAEREQVGTISFVEKDAQKGVLRGTYALDGYTIKFEVLRGAETPPDAMKIYPAVTSHAIEVRVCDEQNFCFINGTGGHGMTSSTWITENPNYEPSTDESEKNFKSLWELHQDLDLQASGTFDGLNEELQSLKDASNQPPDTWKGVPPEYDPLHKYTPSSYNGTPSKSVLSISASGATYTHILQIWRQPLVWPIAYHSSTYAKTIDMNGQIASMYYTCNHGACGGSANMSLYCSRNFSGRTSASLPMNVRCDEPFAIGTLHPSSSLVNCCSSKYSYIPLNLSHVCNDDSTLQRDLMIAGAGPISAPYCADRYLQGQAPYCG